MEPPLKYCKVEQECKSYNGLFAKPDSMSDLVLVVEGIKLYAIKGILMSYSQVFQKMFSSDFKEKSAEEVPLPGKKVDSFVKFLTHIHPVHSLTPMKDSDLQDLLPLADEYQCEHVRIKCEQYIGTKIAQKENIFDNNILFYLWMCEMHNLSLHRNDLLDLASGIQTTLLEKSKHFDYLSLQTKQDLFRKRCLLLETKHANQTEKLKTLIYNLNDSVGEECRKKCDEKSMRFVMYNEKAFCKQCVGRKVKKIISECLEI